MKSQSHHPKLPRALFKAQEEFDRWRRGRQRGTRIPQSLWDLAVELAQTHGPGLVARMLSLDYTKLKNLTGAGDLSFTPAAASDTPFVQIPTVGLCQPSDACTIQLVHPTGCTMQIQLKQTKVDDLQSLAKLFLEHPR